MKAQFNQAFIRSGLLAVVIVQTAVLAAPIPANAITTTYDILDAGTFTSYKDSNTSDAFGGTGFVGIYSNAGGSGPAFVHLFGLEYFGNTIFSETEMQVNISGLAGSTITSAILSYLLNNGQAGSQAVTVTSYADTNGLLGFNESPPGNLGTTSFTSTGLSINSVDVTALLQSALTGGQSWLGLYLSPTGPANSSQWTYTSSGNGGNADSADVKLTVTTAAPAVPEGGTTAVLLGIALAGLAGLHRRLA